MLVEFIRRGVSVIYVIWTNLAQFSSGRRVNGGRVACGERRRQRMNSTPDRRKHAEACSCGLPLEWEFVYNVKHLSMGETQVLLVAR